jgi:hypothetical protein
MAVQNPIELAYRAKGFVPTQAYHRGQRKKAFSPIRAAPALVQAMAHLGPGKLSLAQAKERAKRAVQEPDAASYIEGLNWPELEQFLSTIALFLKAEGQQGKEKSMKKFSDRSQKRPSSQEIGERALDLARIINQKGQQVNNNKLKRLSAHLAAAGDKWEALADLARFYPLKGVPQPAVDEMVDVLAEWELPAFKSWVTQALIYYEASKKGWKGL